MIPAANDDGQTKRNIEAAKKHAMQWMPAGERATSMVVKCIRLRQRQLAALIQWSARLGSKPDGK